LDEPSSSSGKSAEAPSSVKQSEGASKATDPSLLKTLLTSTAKKENTSPSLQKFPQKRRKFQRYFSKLTTAYLQDEKQKAVYAIETKPTSSCSHLEKDTQKQGHMRCL
jgi:hypothetical protein